MNTQELFQQLGLSLMLGLLVGMQRERSQSKLAGFRTFPLVTLLGTLAGALLPTLGPWFAVAGFLGIVLIAVVGNLHKLRAGDPEPGMTTEYALLVMYAVGVFLAVGPWAVAVAVGGGVAILLQLKPQLHGFVRQLDEEDVRAIMQLVLLAFIILPLLPNRTYGPFQVINPYGIWLMVVLIVSISLGGYTAYKFFGRTAGVILGGILGGIISSTATTASYARRTQATPNLAPTGALVIMIASTLVYLRVLLEIQVVAPAFLGIAAPRVLVLLAVSAALCAVWWFRLPRTDEEMPEQENPAELKPALFFGLLYAVILVAVAAAREYAGSRGLFLVATLSGLTDMDAITLSTSRLVATGDLDPGSGWKMVVIAAMSNLVFKGGMVFVMGHPRLRKQIAMLFGAALLSGAAVLVFG